MIFLFYTYPAWVTVIAALRGKESLTGRRLLALALSLAGIAVMVGLAGTGASSVATPGVLLALAGALLYALYIPMIDHSRTRTAAGAHGDVRRRRVRERSSPWCAAPRRLRPASATDRVADDARLAVLCTVIALHLLPARSGGDRCGAHGDHEHGGAFWGSILASVVLAQPSRRGP
jgi:hypothetical protein